jgi:hypothetical protein
MGDFQLYPQRRIFGVQLIPVRRFIGVDRAAGRRKLPQPLAIRGSCLSLKSAASIGRPCARFPVSSVKDKEGYMAGTLRLKFEDKGAGLVAGCAWVTWAGEDITPDCATYSELDCR